MKMKKIVFLSLATVTSVASAVNFTEPGTDIASNGEDGWNGKMPDSSTKAQISHASSKLYASADVQFGEFAIQANCTLTMNKDGVTRTAKVSKLWMSYNNRYATIHGGIWDLQGLGQLSSGNDQGTYNTSLTLDQGCVVTNATSVWVGYKTSANTLKITDSSRVYAAGAALNWNSTGVNSRLEISSGGELHVMTGNFVDTSATVASELVEADTGHNIVITGAGSKLVCPAAISGSNKLGTIIGNSFGGNTMDVSDYGEVSAPYRFGVGFSSNAHRNRAVFRSHAKFALSDLRIGEYGSCSNALEILDGAEGKFSTGYVGGLNAASRDNRFVLSNATVQCRQVFVGRPAGSESNVFEIVGADTSFAVTVTDLPRYPFVYQGSHNRFTMDGASWNYWNSMEFDHAGSSNVIEFVNGANMTAGGGFFTGTNDVASCGNRIYVMSGSTLAGTFFDFTRADNVLTVSNATVRASDDNGKHGQLEFGVKFTGMEESAISGNGLVLAGTTPRINADGAVSFRRGSFLRVEMPAAGYAAAYKSITASTLTFDETSGIEINGVAAMQEGLKASADYTIASTTGGVAIPAAVLAAANARLSGLKSKLAIKNDGKDLVLHVAGNSGFILFVR